MMQWMGKLFKEAVRIRDTLTVTLSKVVSSSRRGVFMADGSPVPVETIQEAFGVSRERAEEIARRYTR
jgi:hypothetical protein